MFNIEDLKVVELLRKTLQRAVDEGYAEVISWNPQHPRDIIWAEIKMLSNQEIEQRIADINS